MIKNLTLLPLLLLIISCSKPINEESLVERNGIYYQVNSETPYSGKSFTLHDNGQKYHERSFKDGKQDGLNTTWYKNGQKRFEVTYKDGKKMSETKWYSGGQKLSQWSFISGELDGLETNWYENGQKSSELTYKDGKVFSSKKWNEDGSVKE